MTGHNGTPKRTLIEVFKKYFVSGEPGQCWEWQGPRFSTGYGRINLQGRHFLAHRVSYVLHKGEIPDDIEVCHKCDNRPCVNPDHLFEGTHRDNMADARIKGRAHPGELTGGAKLTANDVVRIRELHRGGVLQVELAKTFGVTHTNIHAIVNRRSWKHIE